MHPTNPYTIPESSKPDRLQSDSNIWSTVLGPFEIYVSLLLSKMCLESFQQQKPRNGVFLGQKTPSLGIFLRSDSKSDSRLLAKIYVEMYVQIFILQIA